MILESYKIFYLQGKEEYGEREEVSLCLEKSGCFSNPQMYRPQSMKI